MRRLIYLLFIIVLAFSAVAEEFEVYYIPAQDDVLVIKQNSLPKFYQTYIIEDSLIDKPKVNNQLNINTKPKEVIPKQEITPIVKESISDKLKREKESISERLRKELKAKNKVNLVPEVIEKSKNVDLNPELKSPISEDIVEFKPKENIENTVDSRTKSIQKNHQTSNDFRSEIIREHEQNKINASFYNIKKTDSSAFTRFYFSSLERVQIEMNYLDKNQNNHNLKILQSQYDDFYRQHIFNGEGQVSYFGISSDESGLVDKYYTNNAIKTLYETAEHTNTPYTAEGIYDSFDHKNIIISEKIIIPNQTYPHFLWKYEAHNNGSVALNNAKFYVCNDFDLDQEIKLSYEKKINQNSLYIIPISRKKKIFFFYKVKSLSTRVRNFNHIDVD